MLKQVKVLSVLSVLIYPVGIFLLVKSDFQKVINTLRINLTPNSIFLEKWKKPPEAVATKVYLFNVTNAERFLSGEDEKIQIEEIGPIIYYKQVEQKNVKVFPENSTLSYTTTFELSYPEDENIPGIMNQTLIFPNIIALAMASIVNNHVNTFLTRTTLNIILATEKLFVEETVYNILWNFTCPTFNRLKGFIPKFIFPRENAGILYNYVYPEHLEFNVNYGSKHGFENFFKINTINGKPFIPGYSTSKYRQCPKIGIVGSTDGSGINPYVKKSDVLSLYQYMLPIPYPTYYKKTVRRGAIDAYEFAVDDAVYMRNQSNDSRIGCFDVSGNINLPDGLMDSSDITYGIPFALSPPHFLNFKGPWSKYIQGFKPNSSEHYGYLVVEPISGFPLVMSPVVQVNLVVSKFNLNPTINKFSGKILPLVWVNYFVVADKMTSLFIYVNSVVILAPLIQNLLIAAITIFWALNIYTLFKMWYLDWLHRNDLDDVHISFLGTVYQKCDYESDCGEK